MNSFQELFGRASTDMKSSGGSMPLAMAAVGQRVGVGFLGGSCGYCTMS